MSSEDKNPSISTVILVVLLLPRWRKQCHRRDCRAGTVWWMKTARKSICSLLMAATRLGSVFFLFHKSLFSSSNCVGIFGCCTTCSTLLKPFFFALGSVETPGFVYLALRCHWAIENFILNSFSHNCQDIHGHDCGVENYFQLQFQFVLGCT